MRCLTLTFAVLCLTALSGQAASDASVTHDDPLAAIEADYDAGRLSLDEKARLVVDAIKYPDRLPDKYKPTDLAAGLILSQCATVSLRDIVLNWDSLSTSTQDYYTVAFTRQNTQFTFGSASGFFLMHYDTLGIDRVPASDLDISGVPDFVEKCAAYLDTSLAKHRELGYLDPPPDGSQGGDSRFDVYFENMGAYGYAQPEQPGPEPWNDYTSHLVLHHNFIGFPPNDDPEGNQAGAAKATAGHEFHHCVQFAYDASEAAWFMEMDATHMEDITFDAVNDNYNYLPEFSDDPQISLMTTAGLHEYASFIWGIFLVEKFDTILMRRAWEGARYSTDVFDALSDSLLVNFGWTSDSAMAEFAQWNYVTSFRDDGLHYLEGGDYDDFRIDRTHSSYPVPSQQITSSPAGYGCSYVTFYPGAAVGDLLIQFDGNDSRDWKACVIKSTSSTSHTFENIPLDGVTWEGSVLIPDFDQYASVTLAGVNVTENNVFASPFHYSASIQPTITLTSQLMTTDSLIYSGDPRDYSFQVSNTGEVGDVFDILARDEGLGWIEDDSTAIFLAAGSTTVIDVTIKPPVGTPLETTNTVTFTARSRTLPLAADSTSQSITTVLQHGDVNFDGTIDSSDLGQLVAYLFNQPVQPEPVLEAGDWNCDTEVDSSDLGLLVAFLFGQITEGPPCNPL